MFHRLAILMILGVTVFNPSLGFTDKYDSTLDHDFFDPDPRIQELRANVDANHTEPLLGWIRTGRMEMARSEIKYIMARFPNHAKALLLIAVVGKLTKNPALGIPYYERATKLYPQYALTHAQYGNYLVEIGNTAAGIVRLKKAIDMDPKLKPAYSWLAKAYAKTGQPELARQTTEQARTLGYRGRIGQENESAQNESIDVPVGRKEAQP